MPPAATSLRQQAYTHIRERIMNGELRPGEFLSEPMIARELNVSRMPVRDAIRRLQSEQLLDQIPKTGTFVRKLDLAEIRELYQVREALETSAAAAAAQLISEADLNHLETLWSRMRSAWQQADGRQLSDAEARKFFTADSGFHVTVIRASHNRLLAQLMVNIQPLTRLALPQAAAIHNVQAVGGAVEQHGRILEALRNHDSVAASHAMSEHVRYSLAMILATDGVASLDTPAARRLPDGLLDRLERLERSLITSPRVASQNSNPTLIA